MQTGPQKPCRFARFICRQGQVFDQDFFNDFEKTVDAIFVFLGCAIGLGRFACAHKDGFPREEIFMRKRHIGVRERPHLGKAFRGFFDFVLAVFFEQREGQRVRCSHEAVHIRIKVIDRAGGVADGVRQSARRQGFKAFCRDYLKRFEADEVPKLFLFMVFSSGHGAAFEKLNIVQNYIEHCSIVCYTAQIVKVDRGMIMGSILTSRRFLPLFITQFLGAFNDNLFKNAMVILLTYQIAADRSEHAALLVNLAYGLFILPLFLFSPLAGQVADKIDRDRLARLVKLAEVILSIIGGIGLYTQSLPLLMATLFGFGAHSAFFGPVKYAILPQHLKEDELLAGNAYVDGSTFLAILLGTIAGGKLVLLDTGVAIISFAMIASALSGYLSSRKIPAATPPVPELKISFNL